MSNLHDIPGFSRNKQELKYKFKILTIIPFFSNFRFQPKFSSFDHNSNGRKFLLEISGTQFHKRGRNYRSQTEFFLPFDGSSGGQYDEPPDRAGISNSSSCPDYNLKINKKIKPKIRRKLCVSCGYGEAGGQYMKGNQG